MTYAEALVRTEVRQLGAMLSRTEAPVQFITPEELVIFVTARVYGIPSKARRIEHGRAYCAVCCKPRRWVCDVRQFQVCLACIDSAEPGSPSPQEAKRADQT